MMARRAPALIAAEAAGDNMVGSKNEATPHEMHGEGFKGSKFPGNDCDLQIDPPFFQREHFIQSMVRFDSLIFASKAQP